ncbi:MAG: flagellar FliJ family protein [Bacillota bacterium]|nr:flagellar FliJ family protein [Bacillota bacterium]
MKKFKFSLESVLRIKLAREKQKKGELGEIEFRIINKNTELKKIQNDLNNLDLDFENHLKKTNAIWLVSYEHYKKVLSDKAEIVLTELSKLYKEKELCQQQLITVIKERETLEKLREQQYNVYLHEMQKEYEREIGDFMGFHAAEAYENGGQAS